MNWSFAINSAGAEPVPLLNGFQQWVLCYGNTKQINKYIWWWTRSTSNKGMSWTSRTMNMLQHKEVLQHTVSHAIGITVTVRVAILCWQNVLRDTVTRIEQRYKLFRFYNYHLYKTYAASGRHHASKNKSKNQVNLNSHCCTSCLASMRIRILHRWRLQVLIQFKRSNKWWLKVPTKVKLLQLLPFPLGNSAK